MKKIIAILASLLVTAGVCFASDPVVGYWISIDDNTGKATAGWQIWEDNGTLYGKITSVAGCPQDQKATGAKGKHYKDFYNNAEISDMVSVGTTWIFGLSKKADGQWEKGNIIDPNDGSKYGCKITYHKADGSKYTVDTLEMRGSIGPIGRSQYWKSASQEEACGLR